MLREWKLLPERLALHLPSKTAVIADMHLGYVSARRRDGEAVPFFGEAERFDGLLGVMVAHGATELVIAGDAVESARAGLEPLERWCRQLQATGIGVHLTPGNHDEALPLVPGLLVHAKGYSLGSWLVLHDAAMDDARMIVHGHLHPCLRTRRVPGETGCFLHTANRLILPAWCEHAAGVNVLGMWEWDQAECSAVVDDRVVNVGSVEKLRGKLSSRARPFRIGFGLTT